MHFQPCFFFHILTESRSKSPIKRQSVTINWYPKFPWFMIHHLTFVSYMNGEQELHFKSFIWEAYVTKWFKSRCFCVKKAFFCPSLSFFNIMLKIKLRFFKYFFLSFISLFYLILYLIRFKTNNKNHFLSNWGRKEF